MTISIMCKRPCNSISFLTNKGTKQDTINIDKNRIALEYNDIGILVLKPVIDRLDFGFTPTDDFLKTYDPTGNVEEYIKHIKSSTFHSAMLQTEGLSLLTGVSFKKPPFSLYNTNLVFQPPGESQPVIIRLGPKKPGHAFLRIDMNPDRIAPEGMKAFRRLITDMFMTSVAPVEYSDVLMRSKIHRVDVAVDILGARPSDLKITPMVNKKPEWKKSHIYKSMTGRLQTLYPHTKKDKSDTEYVYDRRQDLIDKHQQPTYGEFLHSRYECRAKDTTFEKLPKMNNRCIRISVAALNIKTFWKRNHSFRLFIRYALARSDINKALELIPEKQHAAYKNAYDTSMHKIWDPKAIWSHMDKILKTSGLLP